MDNLIKFISNVEARNFFSIFYQLIVVTLLMTGLGVSVLGHNIPSEYWVLVGTFTANNSSIFEFLFNKKKNEHK